MPELPEQQNTIVCIAGRKGAGKSTKAREILQQCPRLFVFDTMGEHHWLPDRFESLHESQVYLMQSHTYESFQGGFIPEEDDEEDEFTTICDVVYDQGNMMFAIEEVAMLGCSPNFAPKKFKRIMRLGRHRQVDLLYTTQRFGECPRALTAATDYFILFSHFEPRDLDHISERCGPEVARKVSSFPGHEFLVWDVKQRKEVTTLDTGFMIAQLQPARIPASRL